MKSIISTTVLALSLILVSTTPEAGTLKVIVTGLDNDKGVVRIALTDAKSDYDSRDKARQGLIAPIKNKRAEGIFTHIPAGNYAIKLYHDQNNNNKLDTNFIGIPKEAYGFSNNARAKFGPPAFEKSMFPFNTESLTITIEAR